MKLLGALFVSLVLHFLFVQWRWAPVLEDSGSAGRAALAIQQMRFVEAKETVIQEKLLQKTLPQRTQQREVEKKQQKRKKQKERSLLAESSSFSDLEATDKDRVSEVAPPVTKQESVEKEKDIPQEVAQSEVEKPLLEQVDKELMVEVVSTSEAQAEYAGFDQLPTMEQPRYRKAFPPNYPRLARRKGQQGTVKVKAKVGLGGEVETVELLESSGHKVLDDSALKTVKQWQFYPYQVDQKLSVAWVEVPVEFTLGF